MSAAKRDEFSCPCCGTPTDSSYCAPCVAAECGERDANDPNIETCLATKVDDRESARRRFLAVIEADRNAFRVYGEKYDALTDLGAGELLDRTKAEWDEWQRTQRDVVAAAHYFVAMGGAR